MKKNFLKLLLLFLAIGLMLSPGLSINGYAQEATPTPTLPSSSPSTRPMLYVVQYEPRPNEVVSPWKPFTVQIDLSNNGDAPAHNIVLTFSGPDFEPLDGGVWTHPSIAPSTSEHPNVSNVSHAFRVSAEGSWKYSAPLTANVSYTDDAGNPYAQTFTFTIAIEQAGTTAATRTPTPSSAPRPLMVVNSFETDVDPLQPGTSFKLKLRVSNMGQADASNVSLVYGGGSVNSSELQGTMQPGGISGSAADMSNFSPLGSSNIVLLGDMPIGSQKETLQDFIVNVSTAPGIYPLKVSFIYTDPKGNRLSDDQAITLLVYALPQLEISFYRDPGPFMAGQTTPLPIQVTNLARKPVILGNLTVKSDDGEVQDNTVLVGTLEPGGYFTLDASYTPATPGEHKLLYEIRYTDDFNQLRTFNAERIVTVEEGMPMGDGLTPLIGPDGKPVIGPDGQPVMQSPIDPQGGAMFPDSSPTEQSFLTKLWTAIKAFFGFGKGETGMNSPDAMPPFPQELPPEPRG